MDHLARPQPSAMQPKPQSQVVSAPEPIAVGINAAILAVRGNEPLVAVIPTRREETAGGSLPCGFYAPRQHASLEAALRSCVLHHTKIELGSVRQIGTLGGHDDTAGAAQAPRLPIVSVSYLALVEPARINDAGGATWRSWYAYFPWEDWRRGKPACLEDIEPRLKAWARLTPVHCEASAPSDQLDRGRRLRIAFGCDGAAWEEEKALERYELLCEAGIIGEPASGSGHGAAGLGPLPRLWHPMLGDQARVVASAIGELRRAVKCEPVVFELMPDRFTLFELQKTVEAILGPHLHKQNFRRLVETGGLVEPIGEYRLRTGGRPAQLYRFRRDVLLERPAAGVRIRAARG